jgi:hypothetical protein
MILPGYGLPSVARHYLVMILLGYGLPSVAWHYQS